MSKRIEFGMEFLKTKTPFNTIKQYISQSVGNSYSPLMFLNTMDLHECESLQSDLDECIQGEIQFTTEFISDGVENTIITLKYPNIIIGDIGNELIVPMVEMSLFLREWIAFLKT
jgi:aspartate/glutamate racemase